MFRRIISLSGTHHRRAARHLGHRPEHHAECGADRLDHQQDGPLTPSEAKARLLAAARHTGPKTWLRKNPTEAILLAGLTGLMVGSSPPTRDLAARGFLRMFFEVCRGRQGS